MKIVLINPPTDFRQENQPKKKGYVIYPPPGLLYLGTILQKEHDVKVLDLIAKQLSKKETENYLNINKPDIVGITSTTPQIRGAVEFAKLVRQTNHETKIILGGPHITADPSFIKKFPVFDQAILGEAETTLPELIDKPSPKNLVLGEQMKRLDQIPFPDYELIDRQKYYITKYGSNFATVHTARGCPFNCSFCSKPVDDKGVRYRTPKNVVDEIEDKVDKYGIRYVLFTDDTFTISRNHVEGICEEISERKLKIKWGCETRANLLPEELLKLMKKAGCEEISFGVESGSEKMRREVINKHVLNKDIINSFNLCRKYRVETGAFCMLGFPGETLKDMKETLRFVKKIKPDILGLHLTVLMPCSILYDNAVREGSVSEDYWDKYARGDVTEQPVYIPNGLTLDRLKKIQKHIYNSYYFSFNYITGRIMSNIRHPIRFVEDSRMALQLLNVGGTSTGRV